MTVAMTSPGRAMEKHTDRPSETLVTVVDDAPDSLRAVQATRGNYRVRTASSGGRRAAGNIEPRGP